MTKRLLAYVKQDRSEETTHLHEWWFSDDAEYDYWDGMVVVHDEDNPGDSMRPNFLLIPMRNYDEVKVIEKE
jgi:hypothetical protein